MVADLTSNREHVLQVSRSVFVRRCSNRDEQNVGRGNRLRNVGCEIQPSVLLVALDEWADRIRGFRRRGADVYLYANNDWEGFAVRNALGLKERLGLA